MFGANLPYGDNEPLDWDLVKDAMWRRAMGEDSNDDDSSSDSSDNEGPDANLQPNHDAQINNIGTQLVARLPPTAAY